MRISVWKILLSFTLIWKICLLVKLYRSLYTYKIFSSPYTEQKMKFSIKDVFSICDQIRRKLRIS